MMIKRRRGGAFMEFVIALAVLPPVFIGGFQFFSAYQRVEEIQQAAIRGARFAARLPYDSPGETPSPGFRRAVEDAVLGQPAVPGLSREHIRVAMHFEAGRPSELEVKIAGYNLPIPGGAITLDGKPQVRYPYRGYWSSAAE